MTFNETQQFKSMLFNELSEAIDDRVNSYAHMTFAELALVLKQLADNADAAIAAQQKPWNTHWR